ncbi:MAG: dehydrogenase [Alphaproteobacteria bacterium]|nr:MAG: dehydrogenase [Alphaproteobacteria bacterium]
MKTQAALLVKTGEPLVIATIETPPLKRGQVLVEVAYSGACGTQLMEVAGDKGEDKWVPHCLGHEGTGTVIEVDPAVTKVKPGDKVVLSWIKGSGIEAGGCVYDWDGRRVNAGGVTTFQRHAVVSENRLTLLPDGLDMDVAVLLGCAAPTGMGAVYNVLNVRPGDSVAVFGTGGIGLNAVMAAAIAGAAPVIGIDLRASRRDLAKAFGATHVIDPASEDVAQRVRQIAPDGVDLAVEATGVPDVMTMAVSITRMQGGKAVVIGNARHDATLAISPGVFNQGKSLLGTWGGDSRPDRDYGRYGRLIADSRFPVRSLLSEPYRLEDINQALDDLRAGRIGRPLIDMGKR